MKTLFRLSPKTIRIAEWRDAQSGTMCFVIERRTAGKWYGLAINGVPQRFDSRAAAQKKLEVLSKHFLGMTSKKKTGAALGVPSLSPKER